MMCSSFFPGSGHFDSSDKSAVRGVDTINKNKDFVELLSVVCRFGVEIKELQRQIFVSSLSASRVVRAGNEL
jgi:hypothetical protein